eukprot:jgi/Undpi1/2321/HiC_scaffold_13.g05704.m1
MMKLSLLASVAALLVQDAHGFAGSAMGRTFSRQHVVVATRATQLPAQRGLRMSVGDNVKDAVKDAMGEVGADASGGYVKKLKNWWAEKIPAADGLSHASSISEESKPIQALTVAAIVAGHVVAVKSLLKLIVEQEAKCASFASWKAASPAVLGALYIAAGSLHFAKLKEMCNIVPPKGTWGLWYVPGRASFHVKWTGVVEILAGAGLVAGWFGVGPTCLLTKSAAVLFALTAAVTPANLFMFTHGVQFPKGQKFPMIAHVARAAVQCALLSGMWTLAAF